MSDLSQRLRALPAFPEEMPDLDLEDLPEDPTELFLTWLDDAIPAGGRQPHAMTFQTVTADGTPVGRTLILKDLDEHGIHGSTRTTSWTARQLEDKRRAAMTCCWRESGRQVQICGIVHALGEVGSQAVWLTRPTPDGTPVPEWQVYAVQPPWIAFTQS